jgi:plasmid stabilization system protein ParE
MRNFTPQAQADLDEAVGWLLDQGFAAAAAEKLLTAVLDAAAMLAKRPHIGRYQPELLPKPFRFWSLPRHSLILVYDADAEAPTILRVLSTNRELWPLLGDLRTQSDEASDEAEKN